MSFPELFILAAALSMDAFAVSICKGFAARRVSARELCIAGAWFGGFQALMPFLGWAFSFRFRSCIEAADHWIAFALLLLIGANMIRESLSPGSGTADSSFRFKPMLAMAVATSIDALAAGIPLGFFISSFRLIALSCLFICSVTFCFSAAGVKIGGIFKSRLAHGASQQSAQGASQRFEKKAERTGGVFLILLGTKILLDHLGVFQLIHSTS